MYKPGIIHSAYNLIGLKHPYFRIDRARKYNHVFTLTCSLNELQAKTPL